MTPGICSASVLSMPVMFAWATGERTTARWSRPVRLMLSVQRVRPVTSRASSFRARERPSSPGVVGSAVVVISLPSRNRGGLVDRRRGAGLHRVRGALDGADDVLVTGAAAEVALEALAHRVLIRIGVVAEQVDRLHDHSWGTEAALQRVTLVERLLHR